MNSEEIAAVLENHLLWLGGGGGQRADLCGADLCKADLCSADLYGANLCGADLRGADLCRANLRDADLCGADLPHFQICPQEGSFLAYKCVDTGVITIEIPAEAKRTSSLVGRKCRAEFVRVVSGSGTSARGGVYKEGEIYRPDGYDDDIRAECTNGVHFFMTRREAEEWLV